MAVEPQRLAREDVLRHLAEKGGTSSMDEIARDLGDQELAAAAVESLSRQGLVERRGRLVRLTDAGAREAEAVLRRHRAAEEAFKKLLGAGEAHVAAHSLEHLGVDVARLLRPGGHVARLSELERGSIARILAVLTPNPTMLARLYGVGIVPGRRVRVLSRAGGLVIVDAGGGRLAALDVDAARNVLVVAETQ